MSRVATAQIAPGAQRVAAARGRADLVRAWVAGGAEEVAAMAALLGLEAPPAEDLKDTPESHQAHTQKRVVSPSDIEPILSRPADVPFWRVERFTPAAATTHDGGTTTRVLEPVDAREVIPDKTAPHPQLQPLLPWPRLWSRVQPALARSAELADVDVDLLIERLGRGERIDRLPRRSRQGLVARVWLIVDRSPRLIPFWPDQDLLENQLQRLLGKLGVVRWSFHQGPELPPLEQTRRPGRRPFHPPSADVKVVVLGDLGAYAGARVGQQWIAFGRRLLRQGYSLHALIPAPTDRWFTPAATLWNGRLWDRGPNTTTPTTPLTDQGRRRRAERLLSLLSPAIRIEPELLRAVRLLLPVAEADAGTELDAWQHPKFHAGLATAGCIDSETVAVWRRTWADNPKRLRTCIDGLLKLWHGPLAPEIGGEEAVYLHHLDKTLATDRVGQAIELLARLADSIDRGAGIGATGDADPWFRRLEGRLLPTVWDDTVLGAPLKRAAKRVHARDPSAPVPHGLTPADIATDDDPRPRSWWLMQTHGDLTLELLDERHSVGEAEQGSRLGIIRTSGPGVHIRRGRDGWGDRVHLDADRVPLGRLSAEVMVIETDVGTYELGSASWRQDDDPTSDESTWASAIGRDGFGLWADIELAGVSHRLRWIPAGRFLMGSPANEQDRYEDEEQHEEVIEHGFWLGEAPVTQAQWQAVMGNNPSEFKSPTRPVENVSWNDVKQFLARVEPSLELRLPTEKEWEYACRAGTVTSTYAGDADIEGKNKATLLNDIAWYGGNGGEEYELEHGIDSTNWPEKQFAHTKAGTHPVKSKVPNGCGLFDMLGNVWEWCEDAADYDPASKRVELSPEGSYRVLRGGSWFSDARYVRSADHHANEPGYRWHNAGFRLARGQVRSGK